MPHSSAALAIPDMPPAPPPAMHPMDPRRGENLSPMFTAFLCWLLRVEPMTDPAITGIAVCGNSVLAATTHDPLYDAHWARWRNSSATCAAGAGLRGRFRHGRRAGGHTPEAGQ